MHITLTMSTGDANFKGHIQTRWVMCVMSNVHPLSRIVGLNLTWAKSNLGSQLTCIMGLSFLLWVILGRNSMRSLFSLSPLFFQPLAFSPFSHIYSKLVVE